MLKRTVPLLVLAALALPAMAVAQKADITGPAALLGHGPVRGELKSDDGPKRVHFKLSRGLIRFTDLADDMQVACRSNHGVRAGKNDEGKLVVQCAGRTEAVVSASNFQFGGKAHRYMIQIPKGVSGTVNGEFRQRGEDSSRPKPGERPAEQRPADEEPAAEEAEPAR